MCQVNVFLGDEQIMKDVILIEKVPEGVRLVKLFEQPILVPAEIRQIDFMKNILVLEPIKKDVNHA